MTGVETVVGVAAVLVAGVFVLLLRPRSAPPENVVELHRHGVIRHRVCVECGRKIEEHRMVTISGDWFCRDTQDCILHLEGEQA
jgi:hypothetical protein